MQTLFRSRLYLIFSSSLLLRCSLRFPSYSIKFSLALTYILKNSGLLLTLCLDFWIYIMFLVHFIEIRVFKFLSNLQSNLSRFLFKLLVYVSSSSDTGFNLLPRGFFLLGRSGQKYICINKHNVSKGPNLENEKIGDNEVNY